MKKLIFVFYVLFPLILFSQTQFEVGGYFQNLQTLWQQKNLNEYWMNGTTVNRINFSMYYGENLTFNLGLRNIADYGNFNSRIPGYSASLTKDVGLFDLSKLWTSETSYAIYSQIDRLNIFYTNGNFEFQIGRQRVNLGINMVWTPNDIFNSASYLNFSYFEKRGSDAVRAQYYFGYASSFEIVYSLNLDKDPTYAGILHLNKWDYDFQFFAGRMINDYVLGFGYAGDISGAGFYGEATYFRDKNNFTDTTGVLIAAVSTNYTFENSLFVHFEFLYNSAGATENIRWNGSLFSNEYNAKNLSPSKYSLFGEISYPLTPLVKIDFSSIYNPLDNSFYLSPNVNFSLSDNAELLLLGQFFVGKNNTEWGNFGSFYYAQFKWSF